MRGCIVTAVLTAFLALHGPAAATDATPPAAPPAAPAAGKAGTSGDAAEMEALAEAARGLAGYFAHGLTALARADLGALAADRRTPALNAMARATLENGPKVGDIPPAPRPEALPDGSRARRAADAAAESIAAARSMLLHLEAAIAFRGDPGTAAADASAELARVQRALAGHGVVLDFAPFSLGPVREELVAQVDARRAALEEIAAAPADPTLDAALITPVASRPEGLQPPAERALLALLLDSALASPDTEVSVQAEMIRGVAARLCADGGLQAILRLKEELGSSMTLEHASRMASISLASLRAVAEGSGKRADAGP